ncbi:hypothetical protein D3C79_465960 [compost metagenome]
MKIGQQLVGARLQHQALVGQVRRGADIGSVQGEQYQGRVLQHGGEHHHGSPCGPGQQQIAAPDAELGPARGHLVDHIGVGACLAQGDPQTGVPIKALGDGGIVAGKLELMLPWQLHYDVLVCSEGKRDQGGYHHPDGQEPASTLAGGIGLRHTAILSGGALLARVKQFLVIRKGREAHKEGRCVALKVIFVSFITRNEEMVHF